MRQTKKIQLLLGQDLQQFYQIWLGSQLRFTMANSMYQFSSRINWSDTNWVNLSQHEISKLILKLIEKQNVNYLKLMNWNRFRYLTTSIGSSTSLNSFPNDMGRDEYSLYTKEEYLLYKEQNKKKKETRTEKYQRHEKEVSEWISLSLNQEIFTDLEHLTPNKKFMLPYEGRQPFTRWTHSYPNFTDLKSKTFYLKYDQDLSKLDKMMVNNFQNKYLYHAIDDILYSFKSEPRVQDKLLSILYSPVLYLQNNFSIDFFDIWIDEVYIQQPLKVNKFLAKNTPNLEPFSYITIKFLYTTKLPVKKAEPLW
jgi:hypothetical protein